MGNRDLSEAITSKWSRKRKMLSEDFRLNSSRSLRINRQFLAPRKWLSAQISLYKYRYLRCCDSNQLFISTKLYSIYFEINCLLNVWRWSKINEKGGTHNSNNVYHPALLIKQRIQYTYEHSWPLSILIWVPVKREKKARKFVI